MLHRSRKIFYHDFRISVGVLSSSLCSFHSQFLFSISFPPFIFFSLAPCLLPPSLISIDLCLFSSLECSNSAEERGLNSNVMDWIFVQVDCKTPRLQLRKGIPLGPCRRCIPHLEASSTQAASWPWSCLWPHCYPQTRSHGRDETPCVPVHLPHHRWPASFTCRSLLSWCVWMGPSGNDACWAWMTFNPAITFVPFELFTDEDLPERE